jgi:hypothetical protein
MRNEIEGSENDRRCNGWIHNEKEQELQGEGGGYYILYYNGQNVWMFYIVDHKTTMIGWGPIYTTEICCHIWA